MNGVIQELILCLRVYYNIRLSDCLIGRYGYLLLIFYGLELLYLLRIPFNLLIYLKLIKILEYYVTNDL